MVSSFYSNQSKKGISSEFVAPNSINTIRAQQIHYFQMVDESVPQDIQKNNVSTYTYRHFKDATDKLMLSHMNNITIVSICEDC